MKGPHLNRKRQGVQLSGPRVRAVGALLLSLAMTVGGVANAAAPTAGQGASVSEVARLHATLKQFRQQQASEEASTSTLERLLSFFGGGGSSAESGLAEALQASKDRLAQEATGQDTALAAVRERLQARQAPAQALTRHDDTVQLIRQRRAALMAQLNALQQAHEIGNDTQRRQALDSLWQTLEQWRGAPALKAKFNNLPWGTPRHKPRAPHESRVGYSLNLQMFGIKPLQVAGPVPAGTVLPVLPQLPETPQPADLTETEDITLTPAIRAKAAALRNNPSEIYRWVHDNIEFVPSYGSLQGADYTLQTKRGNAFDTSSLLIALLRAANIPARYVYGTVEVPIEQAKNWVGGVTSPDAVLSLLSQGGIPHTGIAQGGLPAAVRMEHVWVEAFVDYVPSRGVVQKKSDTWIPLDASFKQYIYTAGTNLQQAVPFDGSALLSNIASGSSSDATQGSVQNIDQGKVQSALIDYQQRLQNYLTQYHPNATLGDVLGKQIIKAYPGKLLSASLPMKLVAVAGDFQQLPETMRHYSVYKVYADSDTFNRDVPAISVRRSLPSLAGKKLALSYVPASDEDAAVLASFLPQAAAGSPIQPADLPASLPGYLINVSAQLTLDGQPLQRATTGQMLGTAAYTRSGIEMPEQATVLFDNQHSAGDHQAIAIDAQGMSAAQLQQLMAQLESTRQKLAAANLAGLQRDELYGALLQGGVLAYFATNDVQDQVAAQAQGMVSYRLPSYGHFAATLASTFSFGVPVSVRAGGVAADIEKLTWSVAARDNDANKVRAWNLAGGTRMSVNAHVVPEQLLSSGAQQAQGLSAVRALQLAAQLGQKIYTVTPATAGVVLPQLNVDDAVKADIQAAVAAGLQVLVSGERVSLAGWTGTGYVVLDPESLTGVYQARETVSPELPALTGYVPFGLGFEITQSLPEGRAVVPATLYGATLESGSEQLAETAAYLTGCGEGSLSALDCLRFPQGNLAQASLASLVAGSPLTALDLTTALLAGANSLSVSVELNPATVMLGQSATVTLRTSGTTTATPSLQASINNAPLAIDANGVATVTPAAAGTYAVKATVTEGNVVGQGSATLTVRDPNDTTPPVAIITAPLDDSELRLPMVVTGTVQDAGLDYYRLVLQPVGSTDYIELFRGTNSVVNGTLGRIDPTQLVNGLYRLVLIARDLGGLETVYNTTVEIFSEAKVGNFMVAFQDVNVDAMGIPITVTRTYDTRRKFENLDFGFGWSVDYRSGRVQKNMTTGSQWPINREGPFRLNFCLRPVGKRTVMVGMPDGKLHRFDVRVTPECETGVAPQGVHPVFIPRPGTTSTLEAEDVGALIVQGGNIYDPSTGLLYNPKRFTVTTIEGFKYVVEEGIGIREVRDPKGNKLTYTPNGVQHSNGQGVQFIRNAAGRITDVVDPAGQRLKYSYDANGNLVSVQDMKGEVSALTYDTRHTLLTYTDPRNVLVLRNEYDADGRLVAQYDGQGYPRTLLHDLTAKAEVLTDRLGRTTRYEFDDMGNITREVNALGGVTTTTFDAYGNELTVTDPLGRTTTSTYWKDTDKVLTRQDPLGHVTTFTYDAVGNQTSTKDARGHLTVNGFDGYDLKSITDAEGGRSEFYYDFRGNLITMKDAGGLMTTNGYDGTGNRTSESNSGGQALTYTFDANNREKTRSEKRTTAAGVVTLTWSRDYDANGNVVKVTDPLGGVERTEYNDIGKVAARTDRRGQRTTYEYDNNGRLFVTRYADGTTEQVAYDAEGNKVRDTDRAGHVTRYEYDALNRQTKVIHPNGDTASTTYDAAGQVKSTTDARGKTTTFEYDNAGRQTKVIDPQGKATTYTHDANGNVLTLTDARGKVTRYEYDKVNRRTRTILPNGRVLAVTYDGMGRKLSETLPSGRTVRYGYDVLGRLSTVTDHLGQVTRYSYDEAGNKLTQTDAKNRVTRWTYDALNRVTSRTLPDGKTETYSYEAAAGGQ